MSEPTVRRRGHRTYAAVAVLLDLPAALLLVVGARHGLGQPLLMAVPATGLLTAYAAWVSWPRRDSTAEDARLRRGLVVAVGLALVLGLSPYGGL